MSKITFADKEDIRKVDLPRKNYIGADDVNDIKRSVNSIYDNVQLKSYEVELSKTQLNNLNTTGSVTVSLSDLGCESGETINIIPQLCTAEIDPDGTLFSASDDIFVGLNSSTAVSAVIDTSLLTSLSIKKVSNLQAGAGTEIIENPLEISCASDVTGGGAASYLKINIVYQIITA
jgi:hypothetical protein